MLGHLHLLQSAESHFAGMPVLLGTKDGGMSAAHCGGYAPMTAIFGLIEVPLG